MKRTNKSRDYHRASGDHSHRTFDEIKKGLPRREKSSHVSCLYLEKPKFPNGISLSDFNRGIEELKAAKKEKYDELAKAKEVAARMFSEQNKDKS